MSSHANQEVFRKKVFLKFFIIFILMFQVQQIAEYMSYRKLPTMTREKVLKYFDHRYKGKFFDERSILSEISLPLRNVSPPSLPGFHH